MLFVKSKIYLYKEQAKTTFNFQLVAMSCCLLEMGVGEDGVEALV